jgi:hypothetical protein
MALYGAEMTVERGSGMFVTDAHKRVTATRIQAELRDLKKRVGGFTVY